MVDDSELKVLVRKSYGTIAQKSGSCCPSSSCCGTGTAEIIAKKIGYTEDDLNAVPSGSNLGLGCGNPIAWASINEGETVLDLGSGAGFDSFLAARKVGPSGKVIGVDMTSEMVVKAKENAAKGDYNNVDFRLGELENLPVSDSSVDVIISNCVINLVPNKKRVFEEAFRVLKAGGRLIVSDIVLLKDLPNPLKHSIEAYVGCISGAIRKEEYLGLMRSAGFREIEIYEESIFSLDSDWKALFGKDESIEWDEEAPVASIKICAIKV
jgi:arsenite methyltransferase